MNKSQIYDAGCLYPEKHQVLVDDLYKYAAQAGLSGNEDFIWKSVEPYELSEIEKLFLQKLDKIPKEKGKYGLLYCEQDSEDIAERLMAITGLLVRNFIDARYMTLQDFLGHFKEHGGVQSKVLCIPNLYVADAPLNKWDMNPFYDALLHHMSEAKLIIGYIESLASMRKDYPAAVCNHFENKFLRIGGR